MLSEEPSHSHSRFLFHSRSTLVSLTLPSSPSCADGAGRICFLLDTSAVVVVVIVVGLGTGGAKVLTIDSAALENSRESSAAAAVHRHRRFPKGLVGIQALEVRNVSSSFYRCCYGYVWWNATTSPPTRDRGRYSTGGGGGVGIWFWRLVVEMRALPRSISRSFQSNRVGWWLLSDFWFMGSAKGEQHREWRECSE